MSAVIPILQANPVNHLKREQIASRLHLIEILDTYRLAGQFPINYHREERIPVFIDEHGTHCAVGYLMQKTGYENVAQRIAAADNYVWVKDIHHEQLPEWQKASGLSVEELKLIQGAYDFYMPNALTLPNRYETPQKPECILRYFDTKPKKISREAKDKYIWCYGEGKNGVLHGKWEQNYAVGIPWIVGYYDNGDRTGKWEEYYQGTKQLCRTENWRNDKLNGIRKRFDRSGQLIEEILFKDGKAVTKTNYDLQGSLRTIRTPSLDSNLVWTEIYTLGGALIASGHEKVHNPGNLLWFQNIELTVLNSASITSRSASVSYQAKSINSPFSESNLYNSPPLVKYSKEGNWLYFKEYNFQHDNNPRLSINQQFAQNYTHFGNDLYQSIKLYDIKTKANYDSIRVKYNNNEVEDFYGFRKHNYTHIKIRYYDPATLSGMLNRIEIHGIYPYKKYYISGNEYTPPSVVKEIGQYNKKSQRIGEWKHYNTNGILYKTENYLVPWKEEEEEIVIANL